MLSPTYFAVRQAELDKKLDRVRIDKNLRATQETLRELTELRRAYYGAVTA